MQRWWLQCPWLGEDRPPGRETWRWWAWVFVGGLLGLLLTVGTKS